MKINLDKIINNYTIINKIIFENGSSTDQTETKGAQQEESDEPEDSLFLTLQ